MSGVLSQKTQVWKCCWGAQSLNTVPECLPSNANHPSILAFQNSTHIPFPSCEWWLPCVIKYSTSQQCFIKKEVHEFLKLFCKSLWELTMKANTSAGVQLPSYPRIQPDTGICGNLPLWCVRSPPLSAVWKALPPRSATQPTLWELRRHPGQFCQEEMAWGLPDGMCLSMQQGWGKHGWQSCFLAFPRHQSSSLKCICFAVLMTTSLLGVKQVGDSLFVHNHYQQCPDEFLWN